MNDSGLPTRSFADRFLDACDRKGTPCVVGIDPAIDRIPEAFLKDHPQAQSGENSAKVAVIESYCNMVLDETSDLVPAVKPQSAYFERFGPEGVAALFRVSQSARDRGLLVILDAKRGDIGPTAEAYAAAYLQRGPGGGGFGFDCITLNPYLGRDSLEPWAKASAQNRAGLFICVKTSNPGSADFQDRVCDAVPLYELVARSVAELALNATGQSGYSDIGAVVGGTFPSVAEQLRKILPKSLFLVPGVGAQGGDASRLSCYFDPHGRGAAVSSSRAVMYPAGPHADVNTLRQSVRDAARAFIKQVGRPRG